MLTYITIKILLGLLVPACAASVYYHASYHKIGRPPEGGSLFSIPAGGWAALVLFVFIVGLPLYIHMKKDLLRVAKTAPAHATKQKFVYTSLAAFAVINTSLSIIGF